MQWIHWCSAGVAPGCSSSKVPRASVEDGDFPWLNLNLLFLISIHISQTKKPTICSSGGSFNYLSDGKLVSGKIPFGGVEAGGLFVRPCAFTMKRFAPGVLGLHVGVFGGKRMIPVSFSKKFQESFRWWKLSLTWCLYNPLQVRSFRFLDGFHQPRSWSTSWPLVPMNRKIHPGGSEDFMCFFFENCILMIKDIMWPIDICNFVYGFGLLGCRSLWKS